MTIPKKTPHREGYREGYRLGFLSGYKEGFLKGRTEHKQEAFNNLIKLAKECLDQLTDGYAEEEAKTWEIKFVMPEQKRKRKK